MEALGWYALHRCVELAEQASGEPLVCCVAASEADALLLLTDVRLACVGVGSLPPQLLWQIALRDISSLDTDPKEPRAVHIGLHGGGEALVVGSATRVLFRLLTLAAEESVATLVDALLLLVEL